MSDKQRAIQISIEELAERKAERELAESTMIDEIVEYVTADLLDDENWEGAARQRILSIFRASLQRRRELDEEIKVAESTVKALIVDYGDSVKFAGLNCSYSSGRRTMDQAYVKEQLRALGEDPDDPIYYKTGKPFCSIKTGRT